MTTYLRQPEQVTVHCPHAGCKWLKTVWADNSKHKSLAHRVLLTLRGHVQKKHPQAKHKRKVTLINGR